jgi:hypothetical protein
MHILNYIILILLAVAFIAVGAGFILLITGNVRQGRVIRQRLAERVESLRMRKMLKALGIDVSSYLHQVPMNKIKESMNKCDDCSTIDQCDEQLQQETFTPEKIDFCPNQECLTKYTELKQQDNK